MTQVSACKQSLSKAGTSFIQSDRMLTVWGGACCLLLAGVILFTHLNYTLLEPDEGRYAEIPRLMVIHRDYITPKLDGKPYNDKPPLVYWLVALGYQLFGIEAWVGRAVCALAGWLSMVALYLWSCRYLGVRAALLTVLIMCSMLGFIVFSRMLLLDSVLSFLVLVAWLTGHHAIAGEQLRWRWWMVSAIACGLGILAKGPVAAVLVLPMLIAYRWLASDSVRWGWQAGVAYVAVFSLIGLPWYLVMIFTNEGFAAEHFWRHHIRRFLDPYHHKKPFWYYGPAWLVETMPWTGVALLACRYWREWSGPLRFCAASAVWVFAFFSMSSGKLPTYLLPMLALNGLLIAAFLDRCLKQASTTAFPRWLMLGGLGSLIVVIALRGQVAKHFLLHDEHMYDYLVLCVLPICLLLPWRTMPIRWTLSLATVTALFLVTLTVWHVLPDHADQASKGEPSAALAEWGLQHGMPVVAYRGSWQATSFYLQRAELKVYHKEDTQQLVQFIRSQNKVLVLVRPEGDRVSEFVKSLPPDLQVERLFNPSFMSYGLVISKASATANKESDRPLPEPIASRR